MPTKIVLPEIEIVARWKAEPASTTRSMGVEYGCSGHTFSSVLTRHVAPEIIGEIKRSKISRSATLRPDLRTEANRQNCKLASARVTNRGRKIILEGLLRGAAVSAVKRKGAALTDSHKARLSVAQSTSVNKKRGAEHPQWKGGSSTKCTRGIGWNAARRAARKRDENTCRLCAKTTVFQGRNMDVHHRIGYFDFVNRKHANRLSNLVCLCRSCHRHVANGKQICP